MPKTSWPKSIWLAPLVALALVVLPTMSASGGKGGAQEAEYVVLYDDGSSPAAARAAVEAAGGQIVQENADVGVATVTSGRATFLADVAEQSALDGAARNVPVGFQKPLEVAKRDGAALTAAERAAAAAQEGPRAAPAAAVTAEPLAGLQWDMAQIHATADGLVRDAAR